MMTIRRRLLLLLLPALAALMLIGGVVDYRVAMVTTRDAYDRALANSALAVAANLRVENGRLVFSRQGDLGALEGNTLYALVGPDGSLIAGQPELAAAVRAGVGPSQRREGSRAGYGDLPLRGESWRMASVITATSLGPVRIYAAETQQRRAHTQQVMLLGKLLVDFGELDLTLLLVWIAVYYGLRPLDRLTADVERHSARQLQRFDESRVPAELRALIVAFNRVLELLHAAAQAQQRFVADAAHQMRTPVAGLLAQLELLLQDPAAIPVSTPLLAMQRGIQQLARSANQLLALARAEPVTSLHENFEPVALKPLIEELVERYVDRADQVGIDLGAEAEQVNVRGNAGLLEDLLENLLDNALKYAPSGGHVTVRSASDGAAPYLEVEDDGPGIPEAQRARVRERFYRLPGSGGIGCGLGLAIVDEIARVHGAAFSISSGAQGRGVRMRVRFV
ncbi:MAG TPA: ATP-binding protein [Steroidobacteraceae bacterium]|jgi:two-component system sensor histidine kinase TctE